MAKASRLVDRDQMVCIGRISGAHGMQGEVKAAVLTDSPAHYEKLGEVLVDAARGLKTYGLEDSRMAGGQWVLKLRGVATREAAEALKGAELLVAAEHIAPPKEDEYYTADLIGCSVVTVGGVEVGSVSGVLDTGAQPLLQVKPSGHGRGPEMLVPLTEDIVKEVQLDRRTIRIDPPPGLLELNRP